MTWVVRRFLREGCCPERGLVDVVVPDTQTAITSWSVRARRVAVQGASLRSARATCARLARVVMIPDGCHRQRARDLDGAAIRARSVATT